MAKPSELASFAELDERLKRLDEPRWLASRYAEPGARRGLVLVGLLAGEIRRAMGMSEAMLGSIRVQWWRESLEAIRDGGAVRRHDLVEALAGVAAEAPGVIRRALSWFDAVDAILDDHMAAGGHGSDAGHVERHALAEAGLLRLSAEAVADGLGDAEAERLLVCARGWVAKVGQVEGWETAWARAREAVSGLPAAVLPAIAHLSVSGVSAEDHPLQVRWRIFRTVLTRRLAG